MNRNHSSESESVMKRRATAHYEMTREELTTYRGGCYVDPDRYKPGHRDYQPEMLCHTGEAGAAGTRNKGAVTCPACLEALSKGYDRLSGYVIRMREAFGDDFDLLLRRVEPDGTVFVITKHITRSKARVFLPVVFYRSACDPLVHLGGPAGGEVGAIPARDAFRIGKRECQALGWRWDGRHLGWVEEVGGGQSAYHAVSELSRVLFNDPARLNMVEV